MAENIIIKQEYFTNIQTGINSLNEFFMSGFKTKNFPVLDGDFVLEPTIERIISKLNGVDPTWLEDSNKVHDIIQTINDNLKDINPVDGVYQTIVNSNNKMMLDMIDAFIGFKTLQFIADHFQEFGKFVNGIYTFEIYTKPSQYIEILDLFGRVIPLDEITGLDIEEKIFDEKLFVDGIFTSTQIELPASLDVEIETERIANRQDLQNIEVLVDDSVQEAAEVNYFENSKPAHLKYNEKTGKFMISKQFETKVNKLISALRGCDTTDDLIKLFDATKDVPEPDNFTGVVIPCILAKVYSNPKKYYNENYDKGKMDNYIKSYKSIIDTNNGAKRFQNYDLFSTFKTDKEGTIKFIEDFLKLNLINDENASISNNTLLTIFNIFDSRIYLDIAYNMLPDEKKKEKFENQFVTEIRSRINKNSRSKNVYKEPETTDGDKPDTSETVSEYMINTINSMGDVSISDMTYCEQYRDAVINEINSIDDHIFNNGISPVLINEYIGESFNDINNHLDGLFMEANVSKKRETFQQGVCSLMANMEEIVKLDKQHRWNANSFGTKYTTTVNPICFLVPISGSPFKSSERHTNIKQVYYSTSKAAKNKLGTFTVEQLRVIKELNGLVGDLWASVKLFWVNPRNWLKQFNLFKNDKKQKRTEKIADIARHIVALKPKLDFIINNDNFVTESYYDDINDHIFQEATTETNHARFKTAFDLLIRDMQKIVELDKKKQWTNNACLSSFKGETKGNVKQALKYANRCVSGSCGKIEDTDKSSVESLIEKLENMLKTVNLVNINPLIGKNINESKPVKQIAIIAADIVNMKSDFDFLNNAPQKADKSDDSKEAENDKTVQESTIMDFDQFQMIMEQNNTGDIPEYILGRLKMSDDLNTTVTPTPLPSGVPQNDLNDLADSIDAKLDTGGNLDDMIGSGFQYNPNKEKADGKIVVNITNNYTNSFNKDSGNTTTNTNDDHSTGKTTNTSNSNNSTNSHNDSSHDNRIDKSSRKTVSSDTDHSNKYSSSSSTVSTNTNAANNNYNSNDSVDTKDSPTAKDGEQKLSSGQTIQEMFMFLESKEPQSFGNDAGKPPKEDTLTKAMDKDRKSLAKQQKAKKGVQKIANTGKAVLRPITRTKQWLTKVVDSLIRRDEDQVKAELIENKSYRSAIFKASRLALKLGIVGVAYTIQPWLGITAAGIEGLKAIDRQRLKKEIQDEMEIEIDIINDKIAKLDTNNPEDLKLKYKYMRMKKTAEQYLINAPKSTIKRSKSVW